MGNFINIFWVGEYNSNSTGHQGNPSVIAPILHWLGVQNSPTAPHHCHLLWTHHSFSG